MSNQSYIGNRPADSALTAEQIGDGVITEAKIDDGAVTHAKRTYNSGEVIQSVYAELTTRTTSNSAMPGDGTIPQSGEGTELLTVSITPKFANSKLRVRFSGYFSNQQGAAGTLTLALFRDATADAIAANQSYSPANFAAMLGAIERVVAASALTATTFKLRFGPNSAAGSGFAANGGQSVNQFGGVDYCTLTVEEIAA